MSLKVVIINPNYVQQTWPLVKQFVVNTFAEGHDFPEESLPYKPDHILQYLVSGQWLLVAIVDAEAKIRGACTVAFLNYPLHRVAFITTYGGEFVTNKDTMNQFKALMKAQGATKMEALCRPSMVRFLKRYDFEPRNTMVEVML